MVNSTQEEQEAFFWEIIEKADTAKQRTNAKYDVSSHLEELTTLLTKYSNGHLVVFEKVMQEQLQQMFTAEIAELCIILECEFTENKGVIDFNAYLTDDDFIFFRCWLLLKGRAICEDVKGDIRCFDNVMNNVEAGENRAEDLLRVCDKAYELKERVKNSTEIRDLVAKLFPEVMHYDSIHRELNRPIKGGKALQKEYPELVERICTLRRRN